MSANLRNSWLFSSILLWAPLALPLAACGGAADNGSADLGAKPDAGDGLLRPPPIKRTQSEAQLAAKRQACGFQAGAWPAETIGTEYPLGSDIPINHVVVIMQENRSFDNYFGRLVAQGYYKGGDFSSPTSSGFAQTDQLDVPPAGWSNPDGKGGTVVPHLDTQQCYGVNHGWDDMHDQWNGGKNDRFVINNNPGGERAFNYEDDTIIPFYYALANSFAVGDRYFCSALTSTWPNRLFAMAATSFGIGDNSFVKIDTAEHPVNQIFSQLEASGHTWKDYTDGPHQVAFFPYFAFKSSTLSQFGNVRCDLMNDIRNGTLPNVAYIMGNEVGETSDEGPSALPGIGGQWVEGIVRAIFASPAWKDTAIFITYDENGGLADHVPPVPACAPDGYAPHNEQGVALKGAFDITGMRVPMILVSPYARKHFVSHTVYDHTSVVRFIAARFGLPALTARDANAAVPMDMFDFKSPPQLTPPNLTAHTTVDPAVLSRCGQSYSSLTCGM